jgi:hypothetical protein
VSLSAHDRRELGAIEQELAASDPQLAAMLSTFSRLAADEAMPGRERIPAGEPPTATQAAFGLFPHRPARRVPPGPERRHRLVRLLRLSPVAAWLVISAALITVAVLLSHSGGNGTCARMLATACVTYGPAHPKAGH